MTLTIKFEDLLNRDLLNPEFRQGWLRETIKEYIETGDFEVFYRDIEQVIKAISTVSDYAQKIGIDRVQLTKILHGKTKNPSIKTINKILSGLDFDYELKVQLVPKKKPA